MTFRLFGFELTIDLSIELDRVEDAPASNELLWSGTEESGLIPRNT